MVVFNEPGYYHNLDRYQGPNDLEQPIMVPGATGDEEWKTGLGLGQLGTTTNPFQHAVQALKARIYSGASKVEIELPGAGKSSAQSPSPESYGARERQELREIAQATGVQTTTHATFMRQGFSGLTQQGFSEDAAYQNLKEIKKAISFAAEATSGGAIVFHTGEWNRPISETWGEGKDRSAPDAKFYEHEDESKRAQLFVADDRTGELVGGIAKDKEIFRPRYTRAKDRPESIGKVDALKSKKFGRQMKLEADDYIDLDGNWIDETQTDRLFQRVPVWDRDRKEFEVEPFNWAKLVDETDRFNKKYGQVLKQTLKPEVLFVRINTENQILQAKGQSLFYGRQYDQAREQHQKLKEALEFYERIDKGLPDDEKWKIMTSKSYGEYIPPDAQKIPDYLREQLERLNMDMRHIHEASASADAHAKERQALIDHLKPIKDVGLERSAKNIARAGMYAYEEYERNKKNLKEKLYIAPENWQAEQYGSHPDELIELVQKSRERLAQDFKEKHRMKDEEAKKLAAEHIKSTIDIGHLNLWRQHFAKKSDSETEEQRNKRFNTWVVGKTKEMIKAGIVGHIHIADNMGWDDEHLTPGEGNAPIREFVKEMEAAGIKDFVVEPGSFNQDTQLPDTLKHFGSPIYRTAVPGIPMRFGAFRQRHFGYNAPSNYIVGAYAPSNEWRLWSEVPLE